jgi:hypothetical protein
VDGDTLYYATNGQLFSVAKAGGVPKALGAIWTGKTKSLRARGGKLTWINDTAGKDGSSNQLSSCTLGTMGCTAHSMTVNGKLFDLEADAKNAYGLYAGDKNCVVTSIVTGADDPSAKELGTFAGTFKFGALDFDDANVYFAAYDVADGGKDPTTGSLCSVPRTGGTVKVLAPNILGPGAVAADIDDVYVAHAIANNGGTEVVAVSKKGGTSRHLATASAAIDLVPDAANVYFRGGGALRRVPKAGGKAQVLSKSLSDQASVAFAIDATSVYFVTQGKDGAQLVKIAK